MGALKRNKMSRLNKNGNIDPYTKCPFYDVCEEAKINCADGTQEQEISCSLARLFDMIAPPNYKI